MTVNSSFTRINWFDRQDLNKYEIWSNLRILELPCRLSWFHHLRSIKMSMLNVAVPDVEEVISLRNVDVEMSPRMTAVFDVVEMLSLPIIADEDIGVECRWWICCRDVDTDVSLPLFCCHWRLPIMYSLYSVDSQLCSCWPHSVVRSSNRCRAITRTRHELSVCC